MRIAIISSSAKKIASLGSRAKVIAVLISTGGFVTICSEEPVSPLTGCIALSIPSPPFPRINQTRAGESSRQLKTTHREKSNMMRLHRHLDKLEHTYLMRGIDIQSDIKYSVLLMNWFGSAPHCGLKQLGLCFTAKEIALRSNRPQITHAQVNLDRCNNYIQI